MSRFGFIICVLILITYFAQIPTVNSQSSFNYSPYYNRPTYYPGPYPQGSTQEGVLIILDSSYSMEDKINGERKIDIAKRVINDVLNQLSPTVPVGLRVYGHKSDFLGFNACKASELKVP